jgi:hypothetical protein
VIVVLQWLVKCYWEELPPAKKPRSPTETPMVGEANNEVPRAVEGDLLFPLVRCKVGHY